MIWCHSGVSTTALPWYEHQDSTNVTPHCANYHHLIHWRC